MSAHTDAWSRTAPLAPQFRAPSSDWSLLILATAGSLYWLRTTYDDRIYPAIIVADVNLGGMTFADAQPAI